MLVAVRPGNESDREIDRVDSAGSREFDRFVVNARGSLPSTVKCDIVADEVSQKCGCSGKESRESARVAGAQFNRDFGGEMQKGVGATEFRQFASPLFPHCFGNVRDGRRRVPGGEVRRVIESRQRAGNVACPVALVRLQHAFTLSGTPVKPGNHSDGWNRGHQSGSTG